MMSKKKGQAALEFLTTYGWAFLVILVMIGALAYFGVLNPSKYLPDRCTASAGFGCNKDQMNLGANSPFVSFMVTQDYAGVPITVTGVSFTLGKETGSGSGGACEVTLDGSTLGAANYTWQPGSVLEMQVVDNTNCDPGFTLGKKSKGSITIEFHTGDSNYMKDATFDFYGEVRT